MQRVRVLLLALACLMLAPGAHAGTREPPPKAEKTRTTAKKPLQKVRGPLAKPQAKLKSKQPKAKKNCKPGYRQAFADLEAGRFQTALDVARHGPDPVLNKVIVGLAMALPGNDFSFDELAGFVSDHPDWPGLNGILMIAERKIPSGARDDQIVNWFRAHPPLTSVGFYRYMDALDATGKGSEANAFVRTRWINQDFTGDEMTAFHARYAPLLTPQDHRSRLDRLLWANDGANARAMYAFVDPDAKALAEARLALANQARDAESLVSRVPSRFQNDPGLLFERLRWRRKNGADSGAIEILTGAPDQLVRPELWWAERHILIRRLMEQGNFDLACRLAAEHGLSSGFEYTQAEFLAGWLSLRFLNRPDLARGHFESLLNAANTPITRARGSYWLGRSLEALGDKAAAQQAYESAAALNTTFYGQLATARLFQSPMINASPEPSIPSHIRSAFFARDVVKATERLVSIGETDRARVFFKAATNYATQRVEFVLLMELAYQLQRADWAINAAKAANQKNMIVAAGAYPVLSNHIPTPPDLAFTHALIRQESLFNADAGSPAGARGLMQLMPATAKGVAKNLGMKYDASRLTDPAYNLRLGTAFIEHQLDEFNGSIVLALAAYNAGPRNAREWIDQFGDPRSMKVDPIDWIELIPIYETRNYIQRIIENLQFYRARLNGGKAPLLILQDIKR